MKPLILCTFLLALQPALAADRPDAVVKYRQSVMKTMAANMTAISLILKEQVSYRDRLRTHAEVIESMSRNLPPLFPPASSPDRVKSGADKSLWQQQAKFKAAAAQIEAATTKLVDTTRTGDMIAIEKQFDAVGAACNDCHKQFRVRDQS